MIACAIVIQETPNGSVGVDQIPLNDQTQATRFERTVAGVMDIALRIAGEFVTSNSGTGTVIEGKHIEEFVAKKLKAEHLFNFRAALKEAGYKLPGEK